MLKSRTKVSKRSPKIKKGSGVKFIPLEMQPPLPRLPRSPNAMSKINATTKIQRYGRGQIVRRPKVTSILTLDSIPKGQLIVLNKGYYNLKSLQNWVSRTHIGNRGIGNWARNKIPYIEAWRIPHSRKPFHLALPNNGAAAQRLNKKLRPYLFKSISNGSETINNNPARYYIDPRRNGNQDEHIF